MSRPETGGFFNRSMDRVARGIQKTYDLLFQSLGPQGWWPLSWRSGKPGFDDRGYHPGLPGRRLTDQDRFEISIGAILTQNTAWPNVERALARLSEANITGAEEMLAYPDESLKAAIKPCGYFNQKAKKLRIACQYFSSSGILAGKRAPDRDELLGLWGIGPETADSILLYAFDVPSFVIDAYTKRLFSRLGILAADLGYGAFQDAFISRLPLDARLFNEYHALIVKICKLHCSAKPVCGGCPLRRGCEAGKSAGKN
jgi:endonuclease III related protein